MDDPELQPDDTQVAALPPQQSTDPDIDLSGPIPRVTIRPRQPEGPTPVDYDPFAPSQANAKGTFTPTPVDYDPFSAPSVSSVGRDVGQTIQRGVDTAGRKINELRGRSEDVDYRSGDVPFAIRTLMARSENPNEAAKVLEKYYGEGNYGQDPAGNWWVNQNGKKVAVSPSGFVEGLENFGAGLVGSATPIAGSIAGSAIGAPFGPFGMAVGAGLGAAGGWGMDQLVKYYQGLYDQSAQEALRHASNEATLNTALVGALPAARAALRPVGEGLRSFLGVTPTTKKMTERLVEEGARPPILSAAPDFKSIGDKQVLRNYVAGDPWEGTNAEFIRNKFADALRSSGASDAEIASFMSEAANPLSAPSMRKAGEALSESVQRRLGQYNAEAITARNAAQEELRNMETAIRQWANQPVGRLGQDVADAIVNNRRQFGNLASRAYRAIDQMTGDTPIFSMGPTVRAAKEWIDLAEPGLVPPYIKRLAERDPSIPATFAEAHEIRSNLRELLGGIDLTRTPYMHKIGDVASAVDNTFRSLEQAPNLPGQAANALRNMDRMYSQGIAKFYDAQINQLVRSVRSGLIPDPEVVASMVIRDGRTEAAQQIMRMVPDNVRENILRADMRNIISDSSRRELDGAYHLDGMKLLDELDKRKSVYGSYYTKTGFRDMEGLAKNLAALDGKIDVRNLPPSKVSDAIRNFVTRTREIDEFVKGNPLGSLASGRPEIVDRAAKELSMPGDEAQTLAAMNFFGPTSPEWSMVQKHAQENLIRSAVIETPSRNVTISGDAIEKTLRKYTPMQQEMLFPNGMAEDLKEVAKEARFLFPSRLGGMATSLAAKNITLHTGLPLSISAIRADMKWISSTFMGWIADRPTLLRFLADSSRRDPGSTRPMVGAMFRWFINEQQTGPGRGRPQQTLPQ